jgi:hypothetical protein
LGLNLLQYGLLKFILVEEWGTAGFTTAPQIGAARVIVMLSGFGGGTQVVMATEVADHEPTQEVFRTVSEGVLEIILLAFEFLLDPAKQFLVDNCGVESRNL